MEAVARGSDGTGRVGCFHTRLYRATALPAALCALRLLARPGIQPGVHHLGEWVEPAQFAEQLERHGFILYKEKGPPHA